MKNYYTILRVPRAATQDDITTAYRRLFRRYYRDAEQANEALMEELNAAYAVLGDPELKMRYDSELELSSTTMPLEVPLRQEPQSQSRPLQEIASWQTKMSKYSPLATGRIILTTRGISFHPGFLSNHPPDEWSIMDIDDVYIRKGRPAYSELWSGSQRATHAFAGYFSIGILYLDYEIERRWGTHLVIITKTDEIIWFLLTKVSLASAEASLRHFTGEMKYYA